MKYFIIFSLFISISVLSGCAEMEEEEGQEGAPETPALAPKPEQPNPNASAPRATIKSFVVQGKDKQEELTFVQKNTDPIYENDIPFIMPAKVPDELRLSVLSKPEW